jgi:thymidylate synthase ThyX
MNIELFEVQKENISALEKLLQDPMDNYNVNTFNEVMKLINVSFSIEEESRLSSHIVCESLDSYTQQSQRYVVLDKDGFVIPEEIKNTKDEKKFENIVLECFNLYDEMTEEVEGKKRGRGAKDDNHKHGIPIEDGRYIIPLAAKTNVFVTIPGNKVVNFYSNLIQNPQTELQEIGEKFLEGIKNKLGEEVAERLDFYGKHSIIQKDIVQNVTQDIFDGIQEGVIKIDSFKNPIHRAALGGMTSTNAKTPSELYAKWEPENKIVQDMDRLTKDPELLKKFNDYIDQKHEEILKKLPEEYRSVVKLPKDSVKEIEYINWALGFEPDTRATNIAEKILGYGHESIAEHVRVVYGTVQSLTSYHQFERHRLPENIREDFTSIPTDRDVCVPPKIQASKEMYPKFMEMVEKVKNYRQELIDDGQEVAASYLLLNADKIKVITSSNSRIDKDMLGQRTCENASGEINGRANQTVDVLRDGLPYMYDRAGPGCTKGKCPEGELSCGKTTEMREKWGYFVK